MNHQDRAIFLALVMFGVGSLSTWYAARALHARDTAALERRHEETRAADRAAATKAKDACEAERQECETVLDNAFRMIGLCTEDRMSLDEDGPPRRRR